MQALAQNFSVNQFVIAPTISVATEILPANPSRFAFGVQANNTTATFFYLCCAGFNTTQGGLFIASHEFRYFDFWNYGVLPQLAWTVLNGSTQPLYVIELRFNDY